MGGRIDGVGGSSLLPKKRPGLFYFDTLNFAFSTLHSVCIGFTVNSSRNHLGLSAIGFGLVFFGCCFSFFTANWGVLVFASFIMGCVGFFLV
jgi:hypothetical protein